METTTMEAGRAPRLTPEAFAERASAIEREVGRVIVGQRELVRQTLTAPARQQPRPPRGRARPRQDDARPDDRRRHRLLLQPDPVHAGPDAGRHHRHEHPHRGGRAGASSASSRARSSPTSSSPTRSTGRRRRRSRRCSRRCRSTRSRWPGQRYPLDPPFFVLATQNPLEMEGTYPAARGPARPVPVQGHGPLPVRGGPHHDHGPDDRAAESATASQGRDGGRDRRDAAAWPGPSRSPRT